MSQFERHIRGQSGSSGSVNIPGHQHNRNAPQVQPSSCDDTRDEYQYYDNNFENKFRKNSTSVAASSSSGVNEQKPGKDLAGKECHTQVDESSKNTNESPLSNTLKLLEEFDRLRALTEMSRGEVETLTRGRVMGNPSHQNLIRELNRLKESESSLHKNVENLQSKCFELQRFKDESETWREHQKSLEEQLSQSVTKSMYDKLSEECEKVKGELSVCRTRLSRVMGNKLSDNNPEIADLSDKNRPTKLAEKFQEIYDNQWTEAYEAVQKNSSEHEEHTCVQVLKMMLDNIKRYCDEMCQQQTTTLLKAVGLDSYVTKDIPEEVVKEIKDFRKATAEFSAKCVYEKYIKNVDKCGGQLASDKAVMAFIQSCAEFCWLMTVQDPPLAFGTDPLPDERFDTSKYKHYTQTGSYIQFVVWPPLLIQEGGTLLAKGIAQAFHMAESAKNNQVVPKGSVRGQGKSVASVISRTIQGPSSVQNMVLSNPDCNSNDDIVSTSRSNNETRDFQQEGGSKSIDVDTGKGRNKNALMMPAKGDQISVGSSYHKYPLPEEVVKFKEVTRMYGHNEIDLRKIFGERYDLIHNYVAKQK